MISTKKWINPGFLTGPYLPIYGFGLCMLFGLSLIDMSFVANEKLKNVLIVVFMGIAMTFIEYIAGLIFIKGMKVKLWDYSDEWGNIGGIICPKYTFFWCVLGAIYYFFIQNYIIDAIVWFTNNIAFSFVIGYFFGILTLDVANSMNLVVKLRKFAKENDILVKFEELKSNIRENQEKAKAKVSFLRAFKSDKSLYEMLAEYKEKYFDKKIEKGEKIK